MKSLREISTAEFESVLTPANVTQLTILQAALGMGVALFAVVIVVLHLTQTATPDESAVQVLQILSFAHVALLGGAIAGSRFVFDVQFSDKYLEKAARTTGMAASALGHIRSALILRLGLLEAPALFGLVICILTVLNGLTSTQPVFLLNGLSALGFVVFVVQTLPTRDRLLQLFVERIRKDAIG